MDVRVVYGRVVAYAHALCLCSCTLIMHVYGVYCALAHCQSIHMQVVCAADDEVMLNVLRYQLTY